MATLLILLALAALFAGVAVWWLFGTEQGWLRRHERHGQVILRHAPKYPPRGSYACPCGQERDRG